MPFCPKCGNLYAEEALFCGECGFDLREPAPEEAVTDQTAAEPIPHDTASTEAPAEEAVPKEVPPKKKKKTWLWICAVGLCLVAAAVTVWLFLRQTGMKNYGLFLQNGNIFYTDCSEKGTWDTGIFSGIDPKDSQSIYYSVAYIARNSAMSRDGKILFLTETEQESSSYPFTLYYRKTGDPDSKPVEIGDNLFSYAISDDGMSVFCLSGSHNYYDFSQETPFELYHYDLKTGKTQDIAEDAEKFLISSDGQRAVYSIYDYDEDENILYLWEKDEGSKELYSTDGYYIWYCTEDLSTLYCQISFHDTYHSEIYRFDLTTRSKETISSNGAFLAIYPSGAYYYRDHESGELFYYDGEKDNSVADSTCAIKGSTFRSPILVLQSVVKQKEDSYIDCIIVEDRANSIDPIRGTAVIDPDGSAVYISETETGKLYKYPISGKQVEDRELVDENAVISTSVYDPRSLYGYFLTDNRFAYIKEIDSKVRTATLCIDGKAVASDVYYRNIRCPGGILMFYTGYDTETETGTLNVYRDGKLTQIAEDVYDYILTPEKDILYLTDYDKKENLGTLYFYDWETGKAEVCAKDVTAIAYVYPERICGLNFSDNWQYLDMMAAVDFVSTHSRYYYDSWDSLWIDYNN